MLSYVLTRVRVFYGWSLDVPRARTKTKAQLIGELAEVRAQNLALTTAARICEVLHFTPDAGAYEEAISILLSATNSRYGLFGYIDENGSLIVPHTGGGNGSESHLLREADIFPEDRWGDSAGTHAIQEKQTICLNEPSANSPDPYISIRRQIAFPIVLRDEVIGLVQIANKDVDYDEGDVEFMETVAKFVAPVLDARLQKERQENTFVRTDRALRETQRDLEMRLRERTSELARTSATLGKEVAGRKCAENVSQRQRLLLMAIDKILSDAAACSDEEGVARRCLAAARELTGSKFAYFGQPSPSGHFNVIALAGPGTATDTTTESDVVERTEGMEIRGIWGRSLIEGKTLLTNDPIPVSGAAAAPEGHPVLKCFLCVPLMQSGKLVGSMALANKPSGYDSADQEAVETISPLISLVLTCRRQDVSIREAQRNSVRWEGQAVLAELIDDRDQERCVRPGRVNALLLYCLNCFAGITSFVRRSSRDGKTRSNPRRRILIASPRSVFHEAMKSALVGGDETTLVETEDIGEECLKMARDVGPDVVIVDLNSAGMSGFNTVSLLRESLADARIIVVSGCNSKSVRFTARQCGADRLVLGSMGGRNLVRAIRRAMR